MRRSIATAALCGLLTIAMPAIRAVACTPALPTFDVSAERVTAGSELRVSGDDAIRKDGRNGCDAVPPNPSPTQVPYVGVEPETESPSPSSSPLVTLPPLVRVAYHAAPESLGVRISIAPSDTSGTEVEGREIAMLPHRYEETTEDYRFEFEGTVRVPADTAPGKYVLTAVSALSRIVAINGEPTTVSPNYGYAWITVVDPLAASGASDVTTRLALLLLLTGAGAFALNRRLARR